MRSSRRLRDCDSAEESCQVFIYVSETSCRGRRKITAGKKSVQATASIAAVGHGVMRHRGPIPFSFFSFFVCLFISTFLHYIRNRHRHFLFISLFPRTVTLFQISYYPFFKRI